MRSLRFLFAAKVALVLVGAGGWAALRAGDPGVAVARIAEKSLEEHLRVLAAPDMQGRKSPSAGLRRAASYISARFREAGLQPAPDAAALWQETGDGEWSEEDRYLRPFRLRLPAPDPQGCALTLSLAGEEEIVFSLGTDFVPAPLCEGQAEGELEFAGFGISTKKYRYDDLKNLRLAGKIALVFEGEPRHPKKLEGPEVTVEASLWTKLALLMEHRVAGVLVVRRTPEGADEEGAGELDFRSSYARFVGAPEPLPPRQRVPVLEVGMECASTLLGTDAQKLAERMDRSGLPVRIKTDGRRVRMSSTIAQTQVRIDNVVGVVTGTDESLRDEYVVVGAHYDHVGVDSRGRVGPGADDNASGTAALLAIVDALSVAPPRRSILVVAFAAEEDGLLGSKELCKRLPVDRSRIVAMINMDMLGRGDRDEVAVLGINQNPGLEDVLKRAERLSRTGVRKLVLRKGEELWRRSDHYSFHEIGVPALFFFEGLPIERNADYHTWRDVRELVDVDKVARSARLVFNTIWILATDDDRPPAPRN